MGATPPSACPWLDHQVSGLLPATGRPVQTRFRCACASRLKLAANRNSRTHYTKGTPSPLRACARTGSDCLWASGFRSLSLPSSGCFSPFPHGTRALSVAKEYLGLEGGPPMFGQGFTCPALLEDRARRYAYGAVTRCGGPFQILRLLLARPLACSAFARHYSLNLI